MTNQTVWISQLSGRKYFFFAANKVHHDEKIEWENLRNTEIWGSHLLLVTFPELDLENKIFSRYHSSSSSTKRKLYEKKNMLNAEAKPKLFVSWTNSSLICDTVEVLEISENPE